MEHLSSVAEGLIDKLDQSFHGEAWRDVLKAIGVMGVIDNQQLIKVVSMERYSLGRLLNRIENESESIKPFKKIELKVRRGKEGRNPKIYCLTELGAALLRKIGSGDSHAYGETNPIAISHDLCILDLYQLAKKSCLDIKIEQRIYYQEKDYILPDIVFKMENGLSALIEVEQAVHPNYLRRMVESLRRRLSFFSSDTGKFYSPDIRMLFNLPANNKEVNTAFERWKSIVDLLSNDNGNKLPFRVMAMSIHSFLESPEWTSELDENRWIDISKPSCLQKTIYPVNSKFPIDLASYSRKDDLLVLEALSQWFEENSSEKQSCYALPEKHFFEIIELIYLSSHQPNQSQREKAAFPYASLFLLKRYFLFHPDLKELLKRTIDWSGRSFRLSPTTILCMLQREIDIFLNYHGWNNRNQLIAYPVVVSWYEEGPKDFGVKVKISLEEIFWRESGSIIPTVNEIHLMENMLAWVLWAIFTYKEKIGIIEDDY